MWLEHKGHLVGGGENYFSAQNAVFWVTSEFFLTLGVADRSAPSNTGVKSARGA